MRDGGEKRRAQAVGLDGELGAVDVLHEMNPLDGERRLVGQRIEEAALLRGEERALLVAVDADDADRAAARAHRQEQPLRARKVSAPRPAGRSCSKAHFAAARSASSSVSSGG